MTEKVTAIFLWMIGLVLIVRASFMQVPMHEKLPQGFNVEAYWFLVNSNWIRTIVWNLRSVLITYFIWKIIRP